VLPSVFDVAGPCRVRRVRPSKADRAVVPGATVPEYTRRQFRNLLLGDAFIAGTVMYTGARSYTYEDRLHVVPIDRLWHGADSLPG